VRFVTLVVVVVVVVVDIDVVVIDVLLDRPRNVFMFIWMLFLNIALSATDNGMMTSLWMAVR